jgi:translocator protein
MSKVSKNITFKQIIVAILAYLIINVIAGYGIVWLGADISGTYKMLNKPFFAPPTWVFGIVWSFNCLMVTYGILLTVNLVNSTLRNKLLITQLFIALNYSVFQYLSFGSPILFGKLLPIMFFLPTLSMLILTAFAMSFAYQLDTQAMDLKSKLLSGKSIFATFWSLFSWLIIATAVGYRIWMMN